MLLRTIYLLLMSLLFGGMVSLAMADDEPVIVLKKGTPLVSSHISERPVWSNRFELRLADGTSILLDQNEKRTKNLDKNHTFRRAQRQYQMIQQANKPKTFIIRAARTIKRQVATRLIVQPLRPIRVQPRSKKQLLATLQ